MSEIRVLEIDTESSFLMVASKIIAGKELILDTAKNLTNAVAVIKDQEVGKHIVVSSGNMII